MRAGVQGLERRLRDITADFFRSKLGLKPQAVEAVWHEDLILLRVHGFLTRAEEEVMAGRQDDRAMLQAYNERLFENLFPMLAAVLQDALSRPLREWRLILDLGRSECIYLLRLGAGTQLRGRGPVAGGGAA